MKSIARLAGIALLGGCAGVSIDPISTDKAAKAHKPEGGVKGYIVYGPMVVMQVGEAELCTKRAADGKCAASKLACSIGTPTILPDYSKPFTVEIKSGFGKAGVDVQIADGWRLAGVKDTSDNTALLSFLEKVIGIEKSADPNKPCGNVNPGLYRWSPGEATALTPLNIQP